MPLLGPSHILVHVWLLFWNGHSLVDIPKTAQWHETVWNQQKWPPKHWFNVHACFVALRSLPNRVESDAKTASRVSCRRHGLQRWRQRGHLGLIFSLAAMAMFHGKTFVCNQDQPNPAGGVVSNICDIYLSIYLTNYLSVSICIYLYLSVSICIYLYLSVSICIYLYLSVSICIYLYLSVSICIYLSIYLSIYQHSYRDRPNSRAVGGLSTKPKICAFLPALCAWPSAPPHLPFRNTLQ